MFSSGFAICLHGLRHGHRQCRSESSDVKQNMNFEFSADHNMQQIMYLCPFVEHNREHFVARETEDREVGQQLEAGTGDPSVTILVLKFATYRSKYDETR